MQLYNLCGVTLLVFLMTGCSMTYRAGIHPIPSDLKVKEFRGQAEAISVKSEGTEGKVLIGNIIPYSHYADLKQVTDVMVFFLESELYKRGFSIEKDASKSINLNVLKTELIYLRVTSQYLCKITISYGTNEFGRVFSSYNSSWLYNRACDGAITRGVVDLLNDEELVDFLESKER